MKLNREMMTAVLGMDNIFGPKKAVLWCMAALKDVDTGECTPSVLEISLMAGVSKPTASLAIKWLRESGLISVTNRYHASNNRGKDSNSYEFHLPRSSNLINFRITYNDN